MLQDRAKTKGVEPPHGFPDEANVTLACHELVAVEAALEQRLLYLLASDTAALLSGDLLPGIEMETRELEMGFVKAALVKVRRLLPSLRATPAV